MATWTATHPQKRLIRDLWPDKHLYAAALTLLASILGAAYALVAWIVPVRYALDMPNAIRGMAVPWGLALPALASALAFIAYRQRAPTLGFLAAGIEAVTFGALGVSTLVALAAMLALALARREGEHSNPRTLELDATMWPDKALAAALLLLIGALASLAWGAMLLTGWLDVRSVDVAAWGVISLVVGAVALVGAFLAHRQRSFSACVVATIAVALSASFVVIGPALAIGTVTLLAKARREREFDV